MIDVGANKLQLWFVTFAHKSTHTQNNPSLLFFISDKFERFFANYWDVTTHYTSSTIKTNHTSFLTLLFSPFHVYLSLTLRVRGSQIMLLTMKTAWVLCAFELKRDWKNKLYQMKYKISNLWLLVSSRSFSLILQFVVSTFRHCFGLAIKKTAALDDYRKPTF